MRSATAPCSKLPDVGTTIFTVIGQIAAEHEALNLSQGTPNFAPDPALVESVALATRGGHNQYAPMAGVASLRNTLAEKMGHLYRTHKILGKGIAFDLRKGDDALKAKLNAAIGKLKTDGTVKSLGQKYFGNTDISAE
ncbi:transporter substrate-binding domain-containing protein [Paraburkholderia terrae]|uniref:Solute-binding protein family 3/N-terminal domain-containing protein n=1 Tax=Paraburkholderia terrae TaxID=311230 RepID=A0ABN6JVL0_9BURK|nr:hypothetical protein PTKU64_85400 [Paraburkholderia terrae]BDC44840.1 hypothetical protein PTKU15_81370 [Paraburkholderia terrae]